MKFSTDEKLEAVETAMFEISEAMNNLKGIEEYKDTYDALYDLNEDLEKARSELEGEAAGEYTEYIHEMGREYYRSVL